MWLLGLIPLLSLVSFAIPIIALVMLIRLNTRVKDLERKVWELSRGVTPITSPAAPATNHENYSAENVSAIPPAPIAVANTQAQMSASTTPISYEPIPEDRLTAWLKENWLLKLGALLLLIGFGCFVSYAFLNNWIGPAGRITLSLFAGAFVLALGFWRMRTYLTQGSVFVIVGATVVLLTTYAARMLYDFFTPSSALMLMFAVSALVAFASGIYNRKQLGVASVLMAALAPILSHSPTHDYIALFWYLLAVVLGAVWIVVWRDFREVVAAALIVVALYSLPVLAGLGRSDMGALLLFAYGFAAIFFITTTAGLIRLKREASAADVLAAIGNAVLLIVWIHEAATPEWQSLIIAAWATVFMIGSFLIGRISTRPDPTYVYAAIGVGYVAAATAIELSGAALTIAYTVEAAMVSLVLFAIRRRAIPAQRAAFLLLVPTMLALPSIFDAAWRVSVFNEHFFVLAILSVTYFIVAGCFWSDVRASGDQEAKNANTTLIIIGSIVAYVLLWIALHAAMPTTPGNAVMISLAVYTLIGIASYIQGMASGSRAIRLYGGFLVAAVVARLLVVDVWEMEMASRIITFLVIGTLLMSTAFVSRGKKVVPVPPPSA